MKKALIPTQCEACYNIIEVGKCVIKHHVSYYPEKLIKVCPRCHGLIHKTNLFPEFAPDLRQSIRWNRKKGFKHDVFDQYNFKTFMLSIDVGFLTPELEAQIPDFLLEQYWRPDTKPPPQFEHLRDD